MTGIRSVNAILGGWGVSSIVSVHTGFPITITGDSGSHVARPARHGSPESDWRTPTINSDDPDCYIYNPLNPFCAGLTGTVAFADQPLGTFGSAGVGTVRAPGYFNWDFGVGKKFKVSEKPLLRLPRRVLQLHKPSQLQSAC